MPLVKMLASVSDYRDKSKLLWQKGDIVFAARLLNGKYICKGLVLEEGLDFIIVQQDKTIFDEIEL